MANKKEPEAVLINPKVKEFTDENSTPCDFCGRTEVNKLMFGPLYHLEDVTVHYFCMLFSAGLSQYGEDSEGILGFMPKDIKKELHRGRKLKCKYCKRANATVGCSNRKCKVSFHYPCGLEKESNFQFLNNYESYCSVHKRDVAIPIDRSRWECPICYVMVGTKENPLFTPCCQKGVFHRTCIMEMAQAHGVHFFKCPLCNDKETFSEYMRFNGVYVPERDAVWEMEPNAFSDLNEMHNRCDAVRCQCPKGREYSSTSKEEREWRIVRCGGCGAEAVHKKCGNLDLLTYRCDVCASVLAGAAVEEIDSDEEEEEMASHRRRPIPGHTPGRRIIRPGFDGSDDELELPHSRIREITSNGHYDLDSDDSNTSSSASSCSFTEVTGCFRKKPPNVVPIYGKKFQILGHENDDDNTDSDDSEDDEIALNEVNYFTTDSSVTANFGICNGTKSQLAESEIDCKDNPSCTKVDSSNIRDRRPVNFFKRYKKFGIKLDKLKMLSEQIVKTSDQEHGDSHDKRVDQGRSAGLGAGCSYSPEDKLTELLKQSLNQVSSTSSMRQLRSTVKLPDVVKKQLFSDEEQASASTSQTIDKVTQIFSSAILGQSPLKLEGNKNERLTRSRSKESSISGTEESPIKTSFAHDPVIQKIVSSFTAQTAQSTRFSSGSSLTGMSAALIAMSSNSNRKVIADTKACSTDSESPEIVITLSDEESATRRFPSGTSLTGMSAALIAMSSSSNKKVIADTKAGSTDSESHENVITISDDEIVITLSDDDEDARIEPSSSSSCKIEITELKPDLFAKNNPDKPKTSGEVNSSDCSTQPNPPAPSSVTSSVNLRSKRGRDIDSSSRNDDRDTNKQVETSGSDTKRPKRI